MAFILITENFYLDKNGGFTTKLAEAQRFQSHDDASRTFRVHSTILKDLRRGEVANEDTGEVTPVKAVR